MAFDTVGEPSHPTLPWATRRSAGVTTRVSAHLGQTVNMCDSDAPAARETDPIVAPGKRLHIKPCTVSLCHLRDLIGHQAGQHQRPIRAHESGEAWCELAQRS